jgi:hypothetical protein
MEASMKPSAIPLFYSLILIGASCTKDLSSTPLLPPARAIPPEVTAPAAPAGPVWMPEKCRLGTATDTARPGSVLRFAGACGLALSGPAVCQPASDDFYLLLRRPLAGGQSFTFYVNVERYQGPGAYEGLAQIQLAVREGRDLYRWSNFQGTLSVAPEAGTGARSEAKGFSPAAQATFHEIMLSPEPGTSASGTIVIDGTVDCARSAEPSPQGIPEAGIDVAQTPP